MQIPAFRDIIARLSRRATLGALRAPVPAADAALRFNVVVRPETRAFLLAQAEALGSSLAAISGVVLDSVAATECEAVGYSRELLTSRFYMLLKEHGLSLPAAAEVLRSRGITAGDMSDPKLLIEKLDASNLQWLSEHFCVQYDWLVGRSDYPLRSRTRSWYKYQVTAARRLVELRQAGLQFQLFIARRSGCVDFADLDSKNENSLDSETLTFVPFLRIRHQAGPRESYETFEIWEHGQWNYEPSREHIKMVVYFVTQLSRTLGGSLWVGGVSLPPSLFSALVTGADLMPSIFRGHSSSTWCPEDFVEPWSAVAKDSAEWASILGRDDYQGVFREFEQLLASLNG